MKQLILLGLLAAFASAVEIEMSIKPDVVAEDTDVTISCTITPAADGITVQWYKRQGDQDPISVGINVFLIDEAIKRTGRFAITEDRTGDVVRYDLKATGVKREDSGEYGCAIASPNPEIKYGLLSVIAPVEKVELVPIGHFGEDDIEQLPIKENEEYHAMCVADGGFPAPKVTVTLAGKDITSRFDRTETLSRVPNPDTSITSSALGHLSYKVHLNSRESFKVEEGAEKTYNRAEMVCEATVADTAPVSDKLVLVFMVSPTITCKGAYVPHGERNVRIYCTIRADPAVTAANVTWTWSDSMSNNTLHPGEKISSQVTANQLKQGERQDEQVAELYFPRVYLKHFTSYNLSVENVVGKTSASVILDRDEASESKGSSSAIASSLTLIVVAVLRFVCTDL